MAAKMRHRLCQLAAATVILCLALNVRQSVQVVMTTTGIQCIRQLSPCSCETANGGRIDLSPLASTGGAFAYNDKSGPSGNYLYFYNPCNGATCDGSTDAAVCQKTLDKKQQYLMGTQDSAKFDTDPSLGLVLKYIGQSGDRLVRETHLQLLCDTSGRGQDLLTPLDDGLAGVTVLYKMSLLSRHCCETFGPDGGGGGGPSAGDILLIVFFSLTVFYLAAGVALNVALKRQSFGLAALPNTEFWASLPGLVRDGALFTYAAARGLVDRKRGQYESA